MFLRHALLFLSWHPVSLLLAFGVMDHDSCTLPPLKPPPLQFPVNSRQHSALIWFALQCSKSKQCTVSRGYDHMPLSQGYMRAQFPLLMALDGRGDLAQRA